MKLNRALPDCPTLFGASQILPVDAGANRFGGLAVRQGFAELKDRHPGQTPRRQAGLAGARVEIGEVVILKDVAQLVAQSQVGIAARKGGTGDADSFVGNRVNGRRLNRHGTPPGVRALAVHIFASVVVMR